MDNLDLIIYINKMILGLNFFVVCIILEFYSIKNIEFRLELEKNKSKPKIFFI